MRFSSHFALCFPLLTSSASHSDYAAAQEYVRVFLTHSKDKIAKLRIYSVSIRCATAVGDSLKAIEIGREGLASVGVVFPELAEEADALVEETRKSLALTIEGIEVRFLSLTRSPSFPS